MAGGRTCGAGSGGNISASSSTSLARCQLSIPSHQIYVRGPSSPSFARTSTSARVSGPVCFPWSMANQTAGLAGTGGDGAANLCVSGDPFTLLSSVLDACSAFSRRSLSIARVLSVSVAGRGGADSTTRGGAFERRGSARAIFAPQRLHRTISRRPRTFSSAICSCALQLSQLNHIPPVLYLKSVGPQESALRCRLRPRRLGTAPAAPLASARHQRARLLRPIARPVVVRAAEALREHRLAAAGLAADGARAGSNPPPAPGAQARPEAARQIADVDGALQRALDALRDDLPELGADLLAQTLHPLSHAGSSACACHRDSVR